MRPRSTTLPSATRSAAVALLVVALAGCGHAADGLTGGPGAVGGQARAVGNDAMPLRPLVDVPPGASPSPGSGTSSPSRGSRSGGSRGSGAPALPKGATDVVLASEGIAVALPAGYLRVTDTVALDKAITTAPYYRSLTASQRKAYLAQMRTALKLLAVNRKAKRTLAVTVQAAPLARPSDISTEADSLRARLADEHATSIKVVETTVDRLPALRATYRTPATAGRLVTVQYFVVVNQRIYSIAMAGVTLPAADTALLLRTLRFPASSDATV